MSHLAIEAIRNRCISVQVLKEDTEWNLSGPYDNRLSIFNILEMHNKDDSYIFDYIILKNVLILILYKSSYVDILSESNIYPIFMGNGNMWYWKLSSINSHDVRLNFET